jgi:flagellar biosynthetic protein FliO
MFKKWFTLFFLCLVSIAYTQEAPPSPSEPSSQEILPPLPSSEAITQSYEGSFIRVLASIVGLILLVVFTFWMLKRIGRGHFGNSSGGKSIQILEKRPLSQKTVLYLVEMGNKRVLLSESQLEVRALSTIELIEETET